MADITFIAPVEEYSQREVPPFTKLNAQITSKINILKDNTNIINTGLENLLQGVSGGAEQANIPLAMASAPTGWTRDVTQSPDAVLRVTDGATLVSGASPDPVGGNQGGSWQIIGSSAALNPTHSHGLNLHTHNIGSHTHLVPSHAHNDGHNHSIGGHRHSGPSGGATTTGPFSGGTIGHTPGTQLVTDIHTHSVGAHSHGVWAFSAGGGMSGPSIGTTDDSGGGELST